MRGFLVAFDAGLGGEEVELALVEQDEDLEAVEATQKRAHHREGPQSGGQEDARAHAPETGGAAPGFTRASARSRSSMNTWIGVEAMSE